MKYFLKMRKRSKFENFLNSKDIHREGSELLKCRIFNYILQRWWQWIPITKLVKERNIAIVSKISGIKFLPPNCINLYIFTMKLLKLVTTCSILAENYALSSSLEDARGILLELKESQLGWSDMRPNKTAELLDAAWIFSWKSKEWWKVYICQLVG